MSIFNMNDRMLMQTKAVYTATEIHQQPATWVKTCDQIRQMQDKIKVFMANVLDNDDYDVIFTGAGTSEFVGNALFSYINRLVNFKAKSYATTDITASPENYISQTKPTLLISFGRSGNSPESIGAIDNAESVNHDNLYNLFITCNSQGELSKRGNIDEHCLAINLTDETCDLSFAMTSSFTNMYLAALLCFSIDHLEETIDIINSVIEKAVILVDNDHSLMKNVVEDYDFKRIVYLGSNTLKGIAQESALKMLELTAGKIVTMYDTPLGFRHGPKSIVDDSTLTVIYLSDDPYTRQYETDLIKEMAKQRKANKIMVITNTSCLEAKALANYYYEFNGRALDNIYNGLDFIICAQLIALFKSLSLNITPDDPCPTGEVNRVVKGVTLYPYQK